jgi:hypothetical protein
MGRFQMVDDDDEVEEEKKKEVEEVGDEYYHDVVDHRSNGGGNGDGMGGPMVVAHHHRAEEPKSPPRAHSFPSSLRHYNNIDGIDDDGMLFPYYETRPMSRNVVFGWPGTMMAVVLLAMLCHTYLPPAPPPPNMPTSISSSSWNSYEYDDEASSSPLRVEKTSSEENEEEENLIAAVSSSSWRSYLQLHSRQVLTSTKALTIDTPLHILKWLGIALYHDIKSTYRETISSSSSSSYCTTWHIPNSIDTVRHDLTSHGGVLGQDLAVQLLAEALVGWDPTTTKKKPLFILAVGLRSTGKTTLARAMASLYYGTNDNNKKPCPLSAQQKEQVVLYIAPDDPRTVNQLVHRIQQHVQSYPRGSLIIYHDERLEQAVQKKMRSGHHGSDNNIDTMMSNAIFYRLSHTLGISTLVQHLRTPGSWGSPAMMADLRTALLTHDTNNDDETTVILPFAPLTPTVLAAIVQYHLGEPSVKVDNDKDETSSSSSSLLQDVEYMDWTTKQGELILRVALEGARGLPWHRIRALQADTARKIENEQRRHDKDDNDDHALTDAVTI